MKEIQLNKGMVALVDDEDFRTVSLFKWYVATTGYAVHGERVNGKQLKIYMHRFVTNAPKNMQVDHINANRLDNRKENLKICTARENGENTHKRAKEELRKHLEAAGLPTDDLPKHVFKRHGEIYVTVNAQVPRADHPFLVQRAARLGLARGGPKTGVSVLLKNLVRDLVHDERTNHSPKVSNFHEDDNKVPFAVQVHENVPA
jgi:hypothetical protein